MLLGPTPLTWEAQVQVAPISCGPANMAQLAVLEQFQKLHRFPNNVRRFLKTKSRDFSNVR